MQTIDNLINEISFSDYEKYEELITVLKDISDTLYFEKGDYSNPDVIQIIREDKNKFYKLKEELKGVQNNYLQLELFRLESILIKYLKQFNS